MDRPNPTAYLIAHTTLDRQAYRLLLNEAGLELVADSGFAPVAVWAALRCNPGLVVVVADQPTGDVRDAIGMMPRLGKAPVLVASSAVDPASLRSWSQVDLAGFVSRDGGVEELKHAIGALAGGHTYFSAGIRDAFRAGREQKNGQPRLSNREAELLPLLARGLTLREAADRMMVTYKTADSYRTNLLRKLRVRDRVELARYAIRQGIIEP